jgi:hypothetical protein
VDQALFLLALGPVADAGTAGLEVEKMEQEEISR